MALREKGFWDEHYGLELKNYEEGGDEGEVWFGKGLSRRIVDWLVNQLNSKKSGDYRPKVIDIGCGNSFTLLTLAEKYGSGNDLKNRSLALLGIDYSRNSIDLSRKVVAGRGSSVCMNLVQCDFLDQEQLSSATTGDKFDYIVDKGTYDAICLLAGASADELRETQVKYIESLYTLVKSGSIFILASCNHTEDELMSLFNGGCPSMLKYRLIDKIETPKIQFGGKEGSQVTCQIIEFYEWSNSQ